MTVILYNVQDNRTAVVKTLSGAVTYNGYLRDASDVINPVMTFEFDNYPTNKNYARIEEFNRYYFITNIVHVRENLYEIHFHVDVLMTYWDTFKYSRCIVARSETLRVKDLVDNRLWATKDRFTGIKVSSRDPFSAANNPNGVNWVAIVTGITEQLQT